MGTVWMAQQTELVKRLVAVKHIKAGMDSRQVIARFEAERQALALMDRPWTDQGGSNLSAEEISNGQVPKYHFVDALRSAFSLMGQGDRYERRNLIRASPPSAR
jgi:hypothetical protein